MLLDLDSPSRRAERICDRLIGDSPERPCIAMSRWLDACGISSHDAARPDSPASTILESRSPDIETDIENAPTDIENDGHDRKSGLVVSAGAEGSGIHDAMPPSLSPGIDGDPTCVARIGLYPTARSKQHPSLGAFRAAPKLPEQASEDRGCSTAGGWLGPGIAAAVVPQERRVVYDDEGQPLFYSCSLCNYDYTSAIHCRCCDGSQDCSCIPDASRKRAGDPGRESHHHPRKHARNLDGVRDDIIDVSSGNETVHSSDLDEGQEDLDGHNYVNFIENARTASKEFTSVNWSFFSGTNIEAGWEAARDLASNDYTFTWYVGVTDSPVRRMEGQPQPHRYKGYHCLYPLIVTRDAASIERRWIDGLTQELGRWRRGNQGNGGERVRIGAPKFLYLCLRWRPPKD